MENQIYEDIHGNMETKLGACELTMRTLGIIIQNVLHNDK